MSVNISLPQQINRAVYKQTPWLLASKPTMPKELLPRPEKFGLRRL
jgi:hypothetical protein